MTDTVLRVADRCDKCGTQAYYRVEFGNGLTLDFCRRDFLAREAALRETAQGVIDETFKLDKHIPVEPEGMEKGNGK
jgi:ribosomal protein S14